MADVTARIPIAPTSILIQRSQNPSSAITAATAIVAAATRLAACRACQDPAAVATVASAHLGAIVATTATEAMEVENPMVLLRGRTSPLVDGLSPNRDHHRDPAFIPPNQDLLSANPRVDSLRKSKSPPGASIS